MHNKFAVQYFEIHWHLPWNMGISHSASLRLDLWLHKGYHSAFTKLMSVNIVLKYMWFIWNRKDVRHGVGEYERNVFIRNLPSIFKIFEICEIFNVSRKSHRLASIKYNETDVIRLSHVPSRETLLPL